MYTITKSTYIADEMRTVEELAKEYGYTEVDGRVYAFGQEPYYTPGDQGAYHVGAFKMGEAYTDAETIPWYDLSFDITDPDAEEIKDVCDFRHGGKVIDRYN